VSNGAPTCAQGQVRELNPATLTPICALVLRGADQCN
jgi:hypothetical protein